MKILNCFLICVLLTPLILISENKDKEISPTKISGKISIDGIFNEPEWESAEPATNFRQFQPNKDKKSTFKTRVKILYSETHIYFGIICEDKEPEKIIARFSKRDASLSSDDSVGIMIDTFFDRRTAYFFFTNPLGTQQDGRISDNGRTRDTTWDEKWESSARITSTGWNAEIAIPFSILKYNPGKNIKWGLGIVRSLPRFLEKDTWTGPVETPSTISQFGTLKNLFLKKSKKSLKIIPHIITKFTKNKETDLSVGVDIRYAISQSMSTDITINPDFATIEADEEQINLTRFELRLREKRNFFLEGSEIYKQRIRLFYSRRIEDIYGGAKIYGKKNGYEYAFMTVQSKKNEDMNLDSANYSVFRLKKDIFKSSTIGFIGANKRVNEKNYGSIGFDLVHFFSDKINFTGQFAFSYGNFKNNNIAFFLRPSYDSSNFHFHLRYTQLGEKFGDNANSIGFVRDDNRKELDSAISKTWWIKNSWMERIVYFSNYNVYWSTKNLLRSWEIFQIINFDFSNKSSLDIMYVKDFKRYEKDFDNYFFMVQAGYNMREWQSARINYKTGRNFGLKYNQIGAGINYKLFDTISIEYSLKRLTFNPDPQNKSTWLHVMRITNYFTKNVFIKFFYQTNTAIAKKNIQALFVYRFQPPFGTIQFAYQRGCNRFGKIGENWDSFFVKLSYVF